ncbi:M1 family metallopeptidase [Serpentinicella alkaliphila]|nr:M1 family metallopeptidase [Serpentinicella alkaliphila]
MVVMTITIGIQYGWDLHVAQQVIKYDKEIVLDKPDYKINVEFIEETMSLNATQKVTYTNNSTDTLNNIYFHLYPNAFRTEDKAPFEKSEMDRAYPKGFDPGYIKINEVKESKKEAEYKLIGDELTLLRVSLASPLKPKGKVEIYIDFNVKLPYSMGRMGYGENTVNIANWFPIVSVYDNSGWNLDPYYPIGDPFYSDASEFDVTAIFPKEYILATTGNVIRKHERSKKNTYQVKADNVRNFVMIISKDFDVKVGNADNIEVKSFSIDGIKGDLALQYGLDSIVIFNELFGKYPYQQISIVATDFFIGGMEYPNLVMIGKHLYEREEDFPLEYVVAHEIAHQWWYGIVGNNEAKEPWLDEALTEYSTLLYFEQKYGAHIKEQVYEKIIKNQYENYKDLYKDTHVDILRGLEDFKSSYEYSSIVYSRGAMFIDELRQTMGEENFKKGLKEYYNSFRFKNTTTADFYKTFQKESDVDLSQLFKQWLNYTHE